MADYSEDLVKQIKVIQFREANPKSITTIIRGESEPIQYSVIKEIPEIGIVFHKTMTYTQIYGKYGNKIRQAIYEL
jgi:hypothetical protein